MSRRRHQIICSSDDEEDDGDEEPQQLSGGNEENENPNNIEMEILESSTNFQSVTLNSPNQNPTPNREPNIDVSEVVLASYCGIGRVLEGLGLRLRREWLESCVGGLEGSVRGFSGLDDSTKAKLCFEQFLYSDMNFCGEGMLPRDVHKLHLVDLKGPFVLQVDEIVNISCPLRDRYQKAAAGIKRCLKLSMTDGIQRVFGMEYRPIKDLEVLAPSGLKVAICNVHVRHGLLMLVPEVIEFLGGMVEELEEARQRLVNEINKPPRGKRTRSGVVPPLATRATNAAWPREGVTAPEQADTSSRQSMHFQVHERGTSGVATSATEEIHPITPGLPSATMITTPVYRRDAQSNFPSTPAVSVPFNMKVTGPTFSSDAASHAEDIHMTDTATEGIDVPISREHNDPVLLSSSSMEVEELLSDVRSGPATPATPATSASSRSRGSVPVSSGSVHNENVAPDTLSTAAIDVEEIDLVDELDHPFILSGEKENPFTYLASLSAKQAGMNGSASTVTGKIKCFLTGVKGFQFKQSSKYELRVYVDDGSLISEILIDHAKKIGFSPAEVNAALSSSDSKRVGDTKETLKCFQKFLINFEGTMLVHLNEESPIPVATEMNQGCPASDAWLLLKRLKPSTSPRAYHLHHPETINLSP
ncbi:recQ-mediated genome instability protein 1 isoform X2 [Solanum dulcamara]|uniref:recQ-mediated genome instability protein 1 isoform X2 n=1 Tax=Solanum dulcamara TaxID=45834 RepID=UPI002485248C|nr:recQ-mediated genome instability protein 1 isoform X2 [Solanum dulcamara]